MKQSDNRAAEIPFKRYWSETSVNYIDSPCQKAALRKRKLIYGPICVSSISLSILSHYHLSVGGIQNAPAICCVLVGGRATEPIQGTFPQIRGIYLLKFTTNQRVFKREKKERNTRREETRRKGRLKLSLWRNRCQTSQKRTELKKQIAKPRTYPKHTKK